MRCAGRAGRFGARSSRTYRRRAWRRASRWRAARRRPMVSRACAGCCSIAPRRSTSSPNSIFADDVKCAHGATVGELDARALFYLESRGIAPARARGLLTRAFVADALDRIGDEAVREAFAAAAERWLESSLPQRERED